MEPVEINAGGYYLRAMFAGPGEIDDRQPVLDAFSDDGLRRYAAAYEIGDLDEAAGYIQRRLDEWTTEDRCSWAVAEPTTGRMLGEVALMGLNFMDRYAEVSCWTHPEHRRTGVLTSALPAMLRFGFGGLGLHHIAYRHAAGNHPSAALARRCGFTLDGTLREATRVDGAAEDLFVWSRLATDPG